jgi:predicted TPR repeat methyltransferase
MPVSPWRNIGLVVEAIVAANPRTVLDIGVGNGKWGYLVREYIDIWQRRYTSDKWEVRIDGIEVWKPYIHDYQQAIYDRILIGRAQEIVPTLEENYDLSLACDVIEHMHKAEALAMIEQLRNKATKLLLLSIPVGPDWLRDSYNANPYEAHLSEWLPKEFRELGACWINVSKIQDDRRDTALVCFAGSEWRLTMPAVPWGFQNV